MPVTKDDVMHASKGMLQKQFYAVFTTPTNGIGPVMENLEAHLAHQCKIEADGIMVAAGPHWTEDETQWGGDGMFVIRARDLPHAKEIAASDPMHACGARSFTVRPWMVNEGSLTIRLTFSDGKFVLE